MLVKCSDLFPGAIYQGTVVVELWSGVISKTSCLQIPTDFLYQHLGLSVHVLLLLNRFLPNRRHLKITLPILKPACQVNEYINGHKSRVCQLLAALIITLIMMLFKLF